MNRRTFLTTSCLATSCLIPAVARIARGDAETTTMDNRSQAMARIVRFKAAASAHWTLRDGQLTVEFWWVELESEVLLLWQPTDLGGPYPGGWLSLDALRLTLASEPGKTVEWDVAPSHPVRGFRVTGIDAYQKARGFPMSEIPWTLRRPIHAGTYRVAAGYDTTDHASGESLRGSCPLGTVSVSRDLLKPSRRPMNELAISEPDRVRNALPAVQPEPSPAIELFADSFAGVCDHLRDWRCDPYNTEHRPGIELDPTAYVENSRGFGMLLPGLSYAYLATGIDTYGAAATYCCRKIVDNLWSTRWGGLTGDTWLFHEECVLLHDSMNVQGVLDYAHVADNRDLAAPCYELLRHWPLDGDPRLPKNEINSSGEEVHPSFVYNQVLGGVKALYTVGSLFADDEMMGVAWDAFHRSLLPAFTADGYWNYNRGGGLSKHYDLLLKNYVGQLLWYPAWRSDPAFLDCARRGADFCLAEVAEEVGDELIWTGEYTHENTLMLALGKAAMATELLAPLAVFVDADQYGTPLRKTIRTIRNRRDDPTIRGFWSSAWAQFSIVAPLARIARLGAADYFA